MGTLFVDKLDPQSGTSLEIGSSGDTITIPAGATITNNGTQTGFGGTNTPAFFVRQSSNQSITKNTLVKLEFGTEVYDTANAFTSNTFTVPSGQGGKYFIYGRVAYVTANDFDSSQFRIYVNGSSVDDGAVTSNFNQNTVTANYSLNLSAGDTVEAYTYNNYGGAEASIITFAGRTNFGAYKIIE